MYYSFSSRIDCKSDLSSVVIESGALVRGNLAEPLSEIRFKGGALEEVRHLQWGNCLKPLQILVLRVRHLQNGNCLNPLQRLDWRVITFASIEF